MYDEKRKHNKRLGELAFWYTKYDFIEIIPNS